MASSDNFWAMISFFGFAIFMVAMLLFWNGVKDVSIFDADASSIATSIESDAQSAVNQFDFITVTAWLALHIGVLITAWLLRSHPVVFVIAIILTAILVLVAAPLSNAWVEFTEDSNISSEIVFSSSLPITDFIMSNLPLFEVIWAFVTCIVMFGMAKSEGFV